MQLLKKQHPKAVHHCFAYRMGTDKNNFRASDDGEPSSTAGKPILGQIDTRKLTDMLIIVVRYFGASLLGVPGLINAYKSAAAMVLQLVPPIQKPVTVCYEINFDYTRMNEVMRWFKTFDCEIQEQEMQLFCSLTADIPKAALHEIKRVFADMPDVEIKIIG